jgi:hypothetical protein
MFREPFKKSKSYDVSLRHITSDNKGVAFSPDGKIIFVEGVDDDDNQVKIEVVQVLEQSILARKIGSIASGSAKGGKSGPYEVDGADAYSTDDINEDIETTEEEEAEN